jgi:hypothetical protein
MFQTYAQQQMAFPKAKGSAKHHKHDSHGQPRNTRAYPGAHRCGMTAQSSGRARGSFVYVYTNSLKTTKAKTGAKKGKTRATTPVNLITNLCRWTDKTAREAAAVGPHQKAGNNTVQLVGPLTEAQRLLVYAYAICGGTTYTCMS